MNQERIILYSNDCPKCNILATKLKNKNIDFEKVTNITILLEKGFMSVPVLEVNGVTMDFLQANKWLNERGN